MITEGEDIAQRLEVLKQKRTFFIHGVPSHIGNNVRFTLGEFTGIRPGIKSMRRTMTLTINEIDEATTGALVLCSELNLHLQKMAVIISSPKAFDLACQSSSELAQEFGRRFPGRNLGLDQAD